MKKYLKAVVSGLCAAALALGCVGCGGSSAQNAKPTQVTNITVWTYYNGDQLESFTDLVDKFNETVGAEKGIVVSTESQGSVNDLEQSVMDAAEGKVGAPAMPNVFSAYADTVYALDQMGMVVDLAPYLTDDEKAQFIGGYLSEGDFDDNGSVKIFPVAKSTEVMLFNDTDWQPFAEATGASYGDLATVEGLVATAEKYYNWTDAQTAAPDDGKALFGRDAMANYMLVGAQQLGDTIFEVKDGKMTVNFEHDAARKLWDNYYVPLVKGWFAASGRFRSDDIKTRQCAGLCWLLLQRYLLPHAGNKRCQREPRYQHEGAVQPGVCRRRKGCRAAGCRHGGDRWQGRRDRSFGGVPQVVHPAGEQHCLCGGFRLSACYQGSQQHGCDHLQRPDPE